MNAPLRPTKLALRDPTTLLITWQGGQVREYRVGELRDNCPCATCREKRNAEAQERNPLILTVLSIEETLPMSIQKMEPVGNYAYAITFSDGHDSGIFRFDLLRELGHETTAAS